MIEYAGTRLTIRYCEQPAPWEAPDPWVPPSWREAIAHIQENKQKNVTAQMAVRRQQLADRGQLRSPDYWNTEGELPTGKKFYAIKVAKIRAYGWFSNRHKGVFYISHFAFKKGQKLDPADTRRVIENWRQIEEKQS